MDDEDKFEEKTSSTPGLDGNDPERRAILAAIGKMAALTPPTVVTLLLSKRVAAASFVPPPPP